MAQFALALKLIVPFSNFLGYRRSGRQFDEDEIYAHQQQQQQQQVTSPGQGKTLF